MMNYKFSNGLISGGDGEHPINIVSLKLFLAIVNFAEYQGALSCMNISDIKLLSFDLYHSKNVQELIILCIYLFFLFERT